MLQKSEDQCRHCGGRLTAPKEIIEGPRAGQTRRSCFKCGHTEYFGVKPGTLPPEYLDRLQKDIQHNA
jgi:hypothetical protein